MSESKAPDPTGKPPDRRKLTVVMHADMAGYSRLIGLDDVGTLDRMRTVRSKVKRRDFTPLLGCTVAALPLTVRAQQKTMPVVGMLLAGSRSSNFSIAPNDPRVEDPTRQGLREIGYVDGKTSRSNTGGTRVVMIGCRHWPLTSSVATSI